MTLTLVAPPESRPAKGVPLGRTAGVPPPRDEDDALDLSLPEETLIDPDFPEGRLEDEEDSFPELPLDPPLWPLPPLRGKR